MCTLVATAFFFLKRWLKGSFGHLCDNHVVVFGVCCTMWVWILPVDGCDSWMVYVCDMPQQKYLTHTVHGEDKKIYTTLCLAVLCTYIYDVCTDMIYIKNTHAYILYIREESLVSLCG